MEDLLTDQQKAESIKSWMRQNGLSIVLGLGLGIGGLLGWNQWQSYSERQAEEASALYETLLQSVRASQLEQAESGLAALVADYESSPYTDQARLAMARLYLDQGKPEPAAGMLREVASTAALPEIRNIGRLRLARVLIYQEKYDEALKTVADPGSEAYSPAFHDVRGDIYFAMGKLEEARSEYEQALNSDVSARLIERNYVQAKLDDLGGAATELAPPAVEATPEP